MNAPRTLPDTLPDTLRDTLIAEVTIILDASPAKREECRERVLSQIEIVKGHIKSNDKIGHPGEIKRKAADLRDALAKVQMLSKMMPFFSSVLDDMVDYDVSRNYESFQRCLNDAIAASEGIERQIVVPKGKKPRNYYKFAAKSLAVSLVNEFSGVYNEQMDNQVASLLFELLTGIPDVDIPESADEHRPPFLKTRGRIKT
jgi:hypothetical protein